MRPTCPQPFKKHVLIYYDGELNINYCGAKHQKEAPMFSGCLEEMRSTISFAVKLYSILPLLLLMETGAYLYKDFDRKFKISKVKKKKNFVL